MSITPLGSNAPAPREPERARASRPESRGKSAPLGSDEAVSKRGLVADIGARMAELEDEIQESHARVAEALEELDNGSLLGRENLEKATAPIS